MIAHNAALYICILWFFFLFGTLPWGFPLLRELLAEHLVRGGGGGREILTSFLQKLHEINMIWKIGGQKMPHLVRMATGSSYSMPPITYPEFVLTGERGGYKCEQNNMCCSGAPECTHMQKHEKVHCTCQFSNPTKNSTPSLYSFIVTIL